ncbi:hypothetical protein SCLCIDRAFT_1223759 [Scleroderma citrinum Foug A]|uniref:Uncharacterized protein n=1 Tax=Scleroderma citrinum Foug A TaxID=1036808 RepID=A0A0C2ZHY1_9AGAM|nr:hypothetical protein SCLCIDRAFT_1223759 [Scleroderma citrinum Foug A]
MARTWSRNESYICSSMLPLSASMVSKGDFSCYGRKRCDKLKLDRKEQCGTGPIFG